MIERDDSLDGDSVPWSDQSDWLDASAMDSAAEVSCPHCGEMVEIVLDPGGGDTQEYVQDCEVCCRPWLVLVRYDTTGSAEVLLEAAE
jgi:hypothetical protein